MADDWTQYLINPQTIAGLYDGTPPLEGFELRELQLEQRGPSCLLAGNMPRFPDDPLPTWDDGAASLEVRFSLSAVEDIEARGQAAAATVDLSVERADDDFGVVVCGRGEHFDFEVSGIALQIIAMNPS